MGMETVFFQFLQRSSKVAFFVVSLRPKKSLLLHHFKNEKNKRPLSYPSHWHSVGSGRSGGFHYSEKLSLPFLADGVRHVAGWPRVPQPVAATRPQPALRAAECRRRGLCHSLFRRPRPSGAGLLRPGHHQCC